MSLSRNARHALRLRLPLILLLGGVAAAQDKKDAPEVFHHPQETDAINLELRKGTWRSTLCGCDTSGSWGGALVRKGTDLVLMPPPSDKTFRWAGLSSCASVKKVTLAKKADGSLLVTGESQSDERCGRRRSAGFTQRWEPGRVCAVCGGAFQPTDIRPCDGGQDDPCDRRNKPVPCSGQQCREQSECCAGETCYQGKCCQQVGGRCGSPSDCCTGDCEDAQCQCSEADGFCISDQDCCAGSCTQSKCSPPTKQERLPSPSHKAPKTSS